MNYRDFRGTKVSDIGLGTWQLGSADWGNMNKEDAFAILDAFANAGGNFIDTADVYGMGVSESVIGEYLNTTDKTLYVATKLGRRHDEPNGWPQNFSYESMKRHTEDSLKHLGLSRLFLQQLHCIPTAEMQSGKVFDHLRALQQQGLITHFGASVETAEEALICLEQEGLASLQIIFNIFRQHIAAEFFQKAADKGVALIVRVPLASGLLSGKFSQQTRFSATDHRNYNADGQAFNVGETFSGIPFAKGVEFANRIATVLPEGNMATQSLRWILDHPQVTTVIPGASKVNQVTGNVAASALAPLGEGVHQQLQQLYEGEIRQYIRGGY